MVQNVKKIHRSRTWCVAVITAAFPLFVLSGCSSTPAISDSEIEDAISGSDNYSKYHEQFVARSSSLIRSGKCTLDELRENGGWWQSVDPRTSRLVKGKYFTYCGGMKQANKIYIYVK